ncbi:hypothetical protein BDR26DRAFT_701617 [Obelidium mucronatum]|nr:hypothetical protein BDR26DRAFT_701617 [Obelidium mucronatum]
MALLTWAAAALQPKTGVDTTQSRLLVLRTIDQFFWKQAEMLCATHTELNTATADEIKLIVDLYQSTASEWLKSPASKSLLRVMERSYELIVVGVATSLVHKFNCIKYPQMSEFAISLDWKNLEAVVLKDTRAVEALKSLKMYWSSCTVGKREPVFSLARMEGTFQFALEFATGREKMENRWELEVRKARQRKSEHENQVAHKKSRAAVLRDDLDFLKSIRGDQEAVLRERQQELQSLEYRSYGFDAARAKVSRAQIELNATNNSISSKESDIQKTIKAPSFVKNPMPERKDEAMVAIYFACMPHDHEVLSKLLVATQKAFNPTQTRTGTSHDHSWVSYYRTCDPDTGFAVTEFNLHPLGLFVPKSHGSNCVDYIHDSDTCIWYPRGLRNSMSLRCGTNPWNFTQAEIHQAFIEVIQPPNTNLQWMWNYPQDPNSSTDRGNKVFASFEAKPDEFSRIHFETAGSLRAFPNQQIRKIINLILRDKKFPLDNPLSSSLVQQALYQIGEISESGTDLEWKHDLYKLDGAACLGHELLTWLNLIAPTPKNFKSLVVLGELVCYLSQLDTSGSTEFADLARRYSFVAADWAKGIRQDISNDPSLSTKARLELKAKECLINAYAIICYSHLPVLSTDDVRNLSQLLARYYIGTVFAPDSSFKHELSAISTLVQNSMARQISFVDDLIATGDLTDIANELLNMEPPLPNQTVWTHRSNLSYLETRFNGHLYSFNCLTGCLLLDGMPPGRLPAAILTNPLYIKHFGNRDFEVRLVGSVLETVEPLAGRKYHFASLSGEKLLAREIDEQGRIFELIPHTEKSWWSDLPISLLKLYSHWYCQAERLMVFRPHNVLDRTIAFLVNWTASAGTCYEVKSHLSALSLETLVNLKHQFNKFVVLKDSSSLRCFTKLEQTKFIHTLCTPDDLIMIDYARFKLSFVWCGKTLSLQCNEFKGFELRENQRLENSALPLFNNYIVLTARATHQNFVLVPDGIIGVEGGPQVVLSHSCNSSYELITYEVAPYSRDILLAKNIADRLQLAAVYAASGMYLHDPAYKMTGSEMAIELVRQSWIGQPYSRIELKKLCNVMKFGYREPALGVLCAHVKFSASRLGFLHTKSLVPEIENKEFDLAASWAGSQFAAESQGDLNLRRRLSRAELAPTFQSLTFSSGSKLSRDRSMKMDSFDRCKMDTVSIMERKQVVKLACAIRTKSKEFPLNHQAIEDPLGEAIREELETSWNNHCRHPPVESISEKALSELAALIKNQFDATFAAEMLVSEYLSEALNKVPKRAQCFVDIQTAENALPRHSFADFMKMACNSKLIRFFNPYLNGESINHVYKAILLLLQLSVFKTRLSRMRSLLGGNRISMLIKEIFVRKWDVVSHPKWLVFEVEGGLQIRPNQYSIAQQLMNDPGSIIQLNMGEGKTRVIMPMVILALSEKGNLIRVNVLTQLFAEALGHLHSTLTASVLGVKILSLPFHRLVALDKTKIEKIKLAVEMIQTQGGFVIAAPEHRLSLYLKIEELKQENSAIYPLLDSYYKERKWFDLFDESDAILTYKYQLIYAIGGHELLPHGIERWSMVHALLRVLNNNESVKRHLRASSFSTELTGVKSFEFKQIRLIQGLAESVDKTEFWETLKRILVKELIASPPTELIWITEMAETPGFLTALNLTLVDPQSLATTLFEEFEQLVAVNQAQILMLRGLLSFGLLEHCLSMRHAVNFGVDGKRSKRMAVPFLAVDVPSEAAEYSHADAAILLTSLSYYYIGLSDAEMVEALKALLNLTQESQKHHYSLWFKQIEASLSMKEKKTIDLVAKLDLTNSSQVALLCKVYKRSTEAINFWLEKCVFPKDTQLYAQRIMSSSWDLASSDRAVGFSGTKDSHFLLPAQVQQKDPTDEALLGTDGMMLEKLIETVEQFHVLGVTESACWQELAKYCAKSAASALIDTGGLLAGTTNAAFSEYLKSEMTSATHLLGILYFDILKKQWIVLEISSGWKTPESQSPILAKDCFVVFDDARCRGVDKKLRQDAMAVLTLGPRLKKDKLMQGAGRMRQLGCDQKLHVVATDEVCQGIMSLFDETAGMNIRTQEILEWTLSNNKADMVGGLTQWMQQGMHFEACKQDPKKAKIEDDWKLVSLYNAAPEEILLPTWLETKVFDYKTVITNKISEQVNQYGQEIQVLSSQNEECERELQEEAEEEKEVEIVQPVQQAMVEHPWRYEDAINLNAAVSITSTKVFKVRTAVSASIFNIENLHSADWGDKVYGTENFFRTISSSDSQPLFLRPLDAFLYFKQTKTVLLVSEKEADALLGILWKQPPSYSICFGHLSQIKHTDQPELKLDLLVGHPTAFTIGLDQSLVMQVLNGETRFCGESTPTVPRPIMTRLRKMTSRVASREPLSKLVFNRGRSSEWEFSTLKQVCDRMVV